MQLVVFAVVLILSSFLSEGFLSGAEFPGDCLDIIENYGNISCALEGFGELVNVDPMLCTLVCSGNGRPKLPSGICSNNELNCSWVEIEALRNWGQTLENILYKLLTRWCPCYSKK
uniref:Putative salivary secreted protein n=1 Tax=Ixodes scapularis TaxID=6945 RepID=Q4PNB8_IXOSC|nr:putative salivary secreted protein [Ixodes scapularis]